MSQNSIQIPTSGPLQGLTLVQDVNAALDSLARLFSGPAAPNASALGLTGLAGVLWHDTTANLLKLRDQADSTWISLGTLDESAKTFLAAGAQAANARLSDLAGIAWAQGDIAYFNGTNLVKLAAGTSGQFLKTLGVSANPAWASVGGSAAQSFFKNLLIQVVAASIYNASADQVVMGNGSGGYVSFALSVSGATTTSGVLNGLDTGMITAGWYNVFAVSNGSVSGVVLSLNASAPAAGILANYPYYARIGALRYGVSGFLGTIQKGRRVRYVMGGANLASAMPTMASGVAGNVTTPTWVAIATGAFVPPTASSIFILPATAAAGVMLVAPNVSYGTYRIATAPPPYQFDSNSTSASVFELGLESANIYWASTSASLAVLCYGWEDNI